MHYPTTEGRRLGLAGAIRPDRVEGACGLHVPDQPRRHDGSRWRRTTLAVAGLLLAIVGAPSSRASCLPPLAPELAVLDAGSDRDPDGTIDKVLQLRAPLLVQAPSLRRAELTSILVAAEANHFSSDRLAGWLAQGREELQQLPRSPAADRVRYRLAMAAGEVADSAAQLRAAVDALTTELSQPALDAQTRSCLLATRASAYGELARYDLAAGDGYTALLLAEDTHNEYARSLAAYVLAATYRHVGLYDEATTLLGPVVEYTRREQLASFAFGATYTQALLLDSQNRYADSLAAADAAVQWARRLHDELGAAGVLVPRCKALLGLGRLAQAEQECAQPPLAITQSNRRDLVLTLAGVAAELDLARHRAAAARARLDTVLAASTDDLQPQFRPALLRLRARAEVALGDPAAGYDDLVAADRLVDTLLLDQRRLAVAVRGATARSAAVLARNRALQATIANQQRELARQRRVAYLLSALVASALLVGALLVYGGLRARRQALRLRTQEAIARTAIEHAPDALLLIDAQRRVKIANRELFAGCGLPLAGEILTPLADPDAQRALDQALDEIFRLSRTSSLQVAVRGADGLPRQYDLRGAPVIVDGHIRGATLRTTDITEQRALEREILDVARDERQRVSTDLHEGVAQDLVGVSLLLHSVRRAAGRSATVIDSTLDLATRYIDAAILRTRDLSRGLSPVNAEEGSLAVALSRLAADIGRRHQLLVTAHCDNLPRPLAPAVADQIYRLAADALAHAARHRECTHVHLEIGHSEHGLRCTVADDGGEPPVADVQSDTLSFKLTAYRARQLGGSVVRERLVDGGNRLTAVIPIAQAGESAA